MPHINRFSAFKGDAGIRITGVRNDSDRAVFDELSNLLSNFYSRADFELQSTHFTSGRNRYELNLVKAGLAEDFEYLDDGRVRIFDQDGSSRIRDNPAVIIGKGKIVIRPRGFTQKIDRPHRNIDYAVARHEFTEALFDVYFNRRTDGVDNVRASLSDRDSFLKYVDSLHRRYEVWGN